MKMQEAVKSLVQMCVKQHNVEGFLYIYYNVILSSIIKII